MPASKPESKPVRATATVTREIWDDLSGHTRAGLTCYVPAYAIAEAAYRALRRARIPVRELFLKTDCHQISGTNPKRFFVQTDDWVARPLLPMADVAAWLAETQRDDWDPESGFRELRFEIGEPHQLPKTVGVTNGGAPVEGRGPSLGVR